MKVDTFEPIRFKQLSWPVRIGIIGGYVVLAIYSIAFLIGFVIGIVGG